MSRPGFTAAVPSGDVVTRRQFVKAGAAAFAVPLIMPSTGLAGLGRMPANEQVTVGFIGMGIRARNLMRGGWLDDGNLRVLAVCDVDQTRREAYQAEVNKKYGTGDCEAYIDYRDVLAREDIDAVVIATPDHWHAIQIIDACKAGKDVYCEKPLTLTIHEAKGAIAAVRKHGRVFQTGSQQRSEYDHIFVKACEYVRSGRIGKVLTVNVGVGDSAKWCDLPGEEMEPGLEWDRWLGPAPMRAYHH